MQNYSNHNIVTEGPMPNNKQKYVSLLSLLECEEFRSSNDELPIVLGKALDGSIVTFDLCDVPQILIAGATESCPIKV